MGQIGELSGITLLSNIADELLETSFKGMPNIQVEIANVGKKRTLDN